MESFRLSFCSPLFAARHTLLHAGESSYSHFSDGDLGLAIVDRFTFFLVEFLQRVHINSSLTLQDLLDDLRCAQHCLQHKNGLSDQIRP